MKKKSRAGGRTEGDGNENRSKKRKRSDIDIDMDIDWEDEGIWIEVAKWLDAKSIMRVAAANKWFSTAMTSNDKWKYVLLRDLKLQSYQAEDGNFPWISLYESAMYENMFSRRLFEKLISDLGGDKCAIVLESDDALLTQLNKVDYDETELKVKDGYNIELQKMKTGIWIIEMNRVHCLQSGHTRCQCVRMFSIDARHIELLLMEGYTNGTWQYERVGRKVINSAELGSYWRLALFDRKHIKDDATETDIFPLEDRKWRACFLHGIGIKIKILGEAGSIRTEYHTMKAQGSGEVVAIRAYYSQSLYLDDEGVDHPMVY